MQRLIKTTWTILTRTIAATMVLVGGLSPMSLVQGGFDKDVIAAVPNDQRVRRKTIQVTTPIAKGGSGGGLALRRCPAATPGVIGPQRLRPIDRLTVRAGVIGKLDE